MAAAGMKWRTTTGNRTIPLNDARTLPADVGAVVLLVLFADVLSIVGPSVPTPVRALVGLPTLLLVPGYLSLAVVFPGRGRTDDTADSGRRRNDPTPEQVSSLGGGSISWRERLALSFGLSVAVIPLLGFLVAPITGSLSLESVLLGLNAFVLVAAVAAVGRRNNLPADERLRVPHRRWRDDLRESIAGPGSRADAVVAAVLLASVLTAVSVTGFVLLAPLEAEAYTSTTLLTEDESGELVAAGYPSELAVGGGAELTLRVENHEGVETTYTVVAELQRVETRGDTVAVLERDRLFEERETVAAGGTWLMEHTVAPAMTGSDLRLTYHVYRGEPPADPGVDSAYRTTYVWVDVIRPGDSG